MARYSPYLLLKYHCHLNVEVYKYYFKYLYNDAARGLRPAMWVAFCKLRRCLKPARKDRRARLARIQLELHLACTSGRGSGPAACTHSMHAHALSALFCTVAREVPRDRLQCVCCLRNATVREPAGHSGRWSNGP